jgi:hypothetical protein
VPTSSLVMKLMQRGGGRALCMQMLVFLICMMWPLIVFLIAYATCIQSRKKQGLRPLPKVCPLIPAHQVVCPVVSSPMPCGPLCHTHPTVHTTVAAPSLMCRPMFTTQAWMYCCLIFWLLCVIGTFFLPGAWIWGCACA